MINFKKPVRIFPILAGFLITGIKAILIGIADLLLTTNTEIAFRA